MIFNPNNFTILIVDDEPDIRELLTYNLKKEGYKVSSAKDGIEAIDKAKLLIPALIIMDVMMPEMDGIEACQLIKADLSLKNTMITFLTSRTEDYSQIAGFQAGADDYISKPIRPRLLISKIESLLKRHPLINNKTKNARLVINRDKFLVQLNGKELILPKKEFELLELLANSPGIVYNRDKILSIIWGNESIVGERTVDVHIRKLREKIGNDYIRTIKGVGYTFEEN
jgi:two-component system alkaline phosphatase synthesis response regulator PhoP